MPRGPASYCEFNRPLQRLPPNRPLQRLPLNRVLLRIISGAAAKAKIISGAAPLRGGSVPLRGGTRTAGFCVRLVCAFARGHAHGWILCPIRLRLCAGASAWLDFAFDLSAPLRGGTRMAGFCVRLVCAFARGFSDFAFDLSAFARGGCPFGRIFWCFCPFAHVVPAVQEIFKVAETGGTNKMVH